MENVQKHGDINLVTTEKKRNYLLSESNCLIQSFLHKVCWL